MHIRFANRDESAWEQGEQAFQPGDNFSTGVSKAEQVGLRPGCNGYSAFITAFSRRVRQYQEGRRDGNAAGAGNVSSAAGQGQTQAENLQAIS